jgi:hypothetical protein
LVGKSEGQIRLGRARRRLFDNIKVHLKEIREAHAVFVWLGIENNGWLLETQMTFRVA